MWIAPCSCATGMKRIPAAGKMSSASMYAEPTMPKMSVTPCATIVSTRASEGVIFTFPRTTSRLPWVMSFMADLLAAECLVSIAGTLSHPKPPCKGMVPVYGTNVLRGWNLLDYAHGHGVRDRHLRPGPARRGAGELVHTQGLIGARGAGPRRRARGSLGAHAIHRASEAVAPSHARPLRRCGIRPARARGTRLCGGPQARLDGARDPAERRRRDAPPFHPAPARRRCRRDVQPRDVEEGRGRLSRPRGSGMAAASPSSGGRHGARPLQREREAPHRLAPP